MNKLKSIFSFLVLASWLSCTLHCQLAMAGVLQPQKAFAALDAPASAPDSDEDSVCSWMESGGCEARDCSIAVDFPLVECAPFESLWTLIFANPVPRVCSDGNVEPVPPELPQSWQFSLRTALPARAPSFIS